MLPDANCCSTLGIFILLQNTPVLLLIFVLYFCVFLPGGDRPGRAQLPALQRKSSVKEKIQTPQQPSVQLAVVAASQSAAAADQSHSRQHQLASASIRSHAQPRPSPWTLKCIMSEPHRH